MGVTTDYVGYIGISPRLNEHERDYLHAFSRSRRWARSGGPYALALDRRDSECQRASTGQGNTIAEGQPSLWCQWVPCEDGCCVAFDGHEKFYAGPQWLAYLIEHFLRKGASASGDPAFAHFTFDHVADGVIVGSRRDTRELFAIHVEDNVVRTEVLMPGEPNFDEPLPYQRETDRLEAWYESYSQSMPERSTPWTK